MKLSESWKWVKVADIGRIETGSTPSKKIPGYYSDDFPFYKPTDLEAGYNVRKASDNLSASGIKEARFLPNDSILVTCIGATIGKTGIIRRAGACNQQINAIVPSAKFNPNFVYYQTIGPRFQKAIQDNASATTLPILNKSKFRNLEMIFCSLSQQGAIVSKIEELFSELDKGKQQLETAKQQLKIYRQAVLKWAFEGRLTNKWVKDAGLPKGWKWVRLRNVAKEITDGDHQAPPKSVSGIPFITISNVNKTNSKIDFSDTFTVSKEYYDDLNSNRKPIKGDVLYTVTGSFGIPILIDYQKAFCFQRHIGLIRPLESTNQKWVYYLLQSPQVFNQAKETATGTAQKTVALNSLRNFEVPFCSEGEQHRIVEEIESRLSVCNKIEETIATSLQQAEILRQSILKKAFEGRLV